MKLLQHLIICIKVTVTLCKVPLLHFSINRPTTDRLKSISQSNECTLRLKNIPAQVQRSGEGPSFESPLIHFKYERIIVLAQTTSKAASKPFLRWLNILSIYKFSAIDSSQQQIQFCGLKPTNSMLAKVIHCSSTVLITGTFNFNGL